MSAAFDFSEVERLSTSIETAGKALPKLARAAVAKGALNIKTDARKRVSGDPSWKHLAASINFDMSGNAAFSSAEVGYDDVGQGELAGIAEFGSARHAPHPALIPAATDEVPRFEKAMTEIAAKALGL